MNRHIMHFNLLSDLDGLVLKRPVSVSIDKDHLGFAPLEGYTEDEEITLSDESTYIGVNYLKCTITASADTTLAVYYTKESWSAETPDETLTLTTGDNDFYFNHSIYRFGIVELTRDTLKRKSLNTNITGVKFDGVLFDGYRMFDSALSSSYYTILTNIDLSKLNIMKIENIGTMFLYCQGLTSVGDLSSWNVSNVTNMFYMFNSCNVLTSVGDLSNWDTSNVTNMFYMFNSCKALTSVGDLSNWDTSNVTNMSCMFLYCYTLTSVGDLSSWNVSNVSNMSCMFNYCKVLTSVGDLSNWDTSNVSYMSCMFLYCQGLTSVGDLSSWNVSNVTNMYDMFYNCGVLTKVGDLSNWNALKCKNASGMFDMNYNLKEVLLTNLFKNGIITDIQYMFIKCISLTNVGDLSNWDVSNVTNMTYLFADCKNLTSIGDLSNWNTSKVTTMYGMFPGTVKIQSLKGLEKWDVSNVTNMFIMFAGSNTVENVDLSNWNTSKVTNMLGMFDNTFHDTSDINMYFYSQITTIGIPPIPKGCNTNAMFANCYVLTTILASGTISASVSFSDSPLTHDSALIIINALDSENTGTLTLSSTTYSTLTESDIKIATDKGWTITH